MTGTTEILSQNSTMHIVSEKIAALRNHIANLFFISCEQIFNNWKTGLNYLYQGRAGGIQKDYE